jgi:hypothetical protein
MSTKLEIRLYDTNELGELATDEDVAAYEQAVADAIAAAYPGADVTAHARPRSHSDRPTMRDIGGDAEDTRLRESGRLHRDR